MGELAVAFLGAFGLVKMWGLVRGWIGGAVL